MTTPPSTIRRLSDSAGGLGVLLATYLLVAASVFSSQITLDETGSWWVINADFAAVPWRAWTAIKLPLYYLAIDLWSLVAGDSVYALRVFSILCSAATLVVTYSLAARWFDRRTAFWTAAFLIVNSSFLINGTMARSYPLALLLTLISTAQLMQFIDSGGARSFVMWQATLVLSFLTHLYFLPVGLFHLILVLGQPRRRQFLDAVYKWAIYGLGLTALYPVLKQALFIRQHQQEIVYFDPSAAATLGALLPVSFAVPLGLTLAIALLRGRDLRRLAASVLASPNGRVVLVWVLVPVAFFAAYYLLSGNWLLLGRYIYYQVPALVMLLGLLVRRLRSGEVIVVLVITALCTALNVRAELGSMTYSAPDLTDVAREIEATDPSGRCALLTPSLFYESSYPEFFADELQRSFFGAYSEYFIRHLRIGLPRSLTARNSHIFARQIERAAELPCLFVLAFEYNDVLIGGPHRQLSDYLAQELVAKGFRELRHGGAAHGLRHLTKN